MNPITINIVVICFSGILTITCDIRINFSAVRETIIIRIDIVNRQTICVLPSIA